MGAVARRRRGPWRERRPGFRPAPIEIGRHVGWQLQEDGPEAGPSSPARSISRSTGSRGSCNRLMWVRYRLAFTATQEPGWHPGSPRAECLRGGHPIERDVQLDGIELLRIPLQFRAPGGRTIEPASPMLVEEAGGADPDRHGSCLTSTHRCPHSVARIRAVRAPERPSADRGLVAIGCHQGRPCQPRVA